MASEHIVKSYDEELDRLKKIIVEMGGMAESQIASAIEAVVKRDTDLAALVIEADDKVDHLERDLDNLAVRLLALRQPMAQRPARGRRRAEDRQRSRTHLRLCGECRQALDRACRSRR